MINALALFLAAFLLFLPFRLHSQEDDPRELFAKGYALFSAGELERSEKLLLKALEFESPLKDYCLYFLGMTFLRQGEPESARQYLDRIKYEFPQSIWAPHAELESVKISIEEKDYSTAIEKLTALQARTTKQEISDQIRYLHGQINEFQGSHEKAHALYQELRRLSPNSVWTAKAKREIRKLRKLYPHLYGLTTIPALAAEAELLLQERDYVEAEEVYLKILDLTPPPDQRPGFLMGLADVYRALRQRGKALPILTEILRAYHDSPEAPKALHHLALIYWNRDENLKALGYFSRFKEGYASSPFADFAHYASARIYESLGQEEEARQFYESFPSQFPHSRLQEEAQWRLAWLHYNQGDFNSAREAFKQVRAVKGRERYKTASLYWQARTALKTKRAEEAKQNFLQIVDSPEDSYYRESAMRELEKLGVVVEEQKNEIHPLANATLSPTPKIIFHLARARALGEVSLNDLAVAELDEIKSRNQGEPLLTFTLVREYARAGAHAQSVSLVSRIDPSQTGLERYRYPLAYWGTINEIAEKRGLDPFLVLALIRQESLFDPKAVSSASAAGLMQILPSTAVRTAAQLGLSPPRPENLFEPELNLTLGTQYLKGLLRRYSNNLVKALAAYNAGESAVDRWERRIQTEDLEEFIEQIPYGETRLYVKLVLRNHLSYQRIYGNHR